MQSLGGSTETLSGPHIKFKSINIDFPANESPNRETLILHHRNEVRRLRLRIIGLEKRNKVNFCNFCSFLFLSKFWTKIYP